MVNLYRCNGLSSIPDPVFEVYYCLYRWRDDRRKRQGRCNI